MVLRNMLIYYGTHPTNQVVGIKSEQFAQLVLPQCCTPPPKQGKPERYMSILTIQPWNRERVLGAINSNNRPLLLASCTTAKHVFFFKTIGNNRLLATTIDNRLLAIHNTNHTSTIWTLRRTAPSERIVDQHTERWHEATHSRAARVQRAGDGGSMQMTRSSRQR